jgi:hypothetical protein
MRKSTKKTKRKLPRQSAAATAQALLEAGEAVVDAYVRSGPAADDGPVDVLPFVSIDDVLRATTKRRHRAAVARGALAKGTEVTTLTPGAFYRAFPPSPRAGHRGKGEALATFRRELGRRIVSSDDYRETTAVIDVDVEAFPPTAGRHALRCAMEGAFRRWLDSSIDCVYYGLVLHAKDAEIGVWLAAALANQLDHLEGVHDRMLRRFGRRPRAGVTTRQLGAAIRSAIAGMALDARVPGSPTKDRVRVTEGESELSGEWFLATLVVDAIMMALTEPIPPGESR